MLVVVCWLWSGSAQCTRELAVEVRPAGNTATRPSQLRSGGERYQADLAGETTRRTRRRTPADIKSNNPHLTGGEQPGTSMSGHRSYRPMSLANVFIQAAPTFRSSAMSRAPDASLVEGSFTVTEAVTAGAAEVTWDAAKSKGPSQLTKMVDGATNGASKLSSSGHDVLDSNWPKTSKLRVVRKWHP